MMPVISARLANRFSLLFGYGPRPTGARIIAYGSGMYRDDPHVTLSEGARIRVLHWNLLHRTWF
ncbi:hypothetical protein GCM10010106_47080 [Thermopolyspora flexuosa]|nr:hypothetical protein GCM10010106_47080 [Thermopolyspora flexuosa]